MTQRYLNFSIDEYQMVRLKQGEKMTLTLNQAVTMAASDKKQCVVRIEMLSEIEAEAFRLTHAVI